MEKNKNLEKLAHEIVSPERFGRVALNLAQQELFTPVELEMMNRKDDGSAQ